MGGAPVAGSEGAAIAISRITRKHSVLILNSASINALVQALLMIAISVPMAVHAYRDPLHGRTFQRTIVVLVGVCGVAGSISLVALTQTEFMFRIMFWISAVTGSLWFIGFWMYVIAKIRDSFQQDNANRSEADS